MGFSCIVVCKILMGEDGEVEREPKNLRITFSISLFLSLTYYFNTTNFLTKYQNKKRRKLSSPIILCAFSGRFFPIRLWNGKKKGKEEKSLQLEMGESPTSEFAVWWGKKLRFSFVCLCEHVESCSRFPYSDLMKVNEAAVNVNQKHFTINSQTSEKVKKVPFIEVFFQRNKEKTSRKIPPFVSVRELLHSILCCFYHSFRINTRASVISFCVDKY